MSTQPDGYAGDVTPQQAWEMLQQGARMVDVRTRAEWSYVGAPDLAGLSQPLMQVEWVRFPDGSPNPDFVNQVRAGLEGQDEQTPLVFLCRSGVRSIAAAKAATEAGYPNAYNVLEGFEGGLDEAGHRGTEGWRAAGLPWRQS
ncbi:MAG: rhodanese-like domain-containing protein [Actinomycetales bacterium]